MRFPAPRLAALHATSLASALACAVAGAAWAPPASASQATVLHVFGAKKDGDHLANSMIMDDAGNLYGTTTDGGKGGGTVFRLAPPADGGDAPWAESVLFSFDEANPIHESRTGSTPESGLWFGDDGSLFGTTGVGSPIGAGNVFQLTAPAGGTGSWTETVIYDFRSGADDAGFPSSRTIALGASGARFGLTAGGGPANIGALYSITPPKAPGGPWTEALLHAFDGTDGALPGGDLVADAKGNLYGVALVGGAAGLGTVFRLSPPKKAGGAWTETTLHSFTGGSDGRAPGQKLFIDPKGALWGTTGSGGRHLLGNIFRLSPPGKAGGAWTFKNMHVFVDAAQGQVPSSGLVPDGAGGFYGTTEVGGSADCGTVYHFQPPTKAGEDGVLTTVHSFGGGTGGGVPTGDLLLKDGVLYGQTFGSDDGDSLECTAESVAYKLVP